MLWTDYESNSGESHTDTVLIYGINRTIPPVFCFSFDCLANPHHPFCSSESNSESYEHKKMVQASTIVLILVFVVVLILVYRLNDELLWFLWCQVCFTCVIISPTTAVLKLWMESPHEGGGSWVYGEVLRLSRRMPSRPLSCRRKPRLGVTPRWSFTVRMASTRVRLWRIIR